MVDVFKKLGVSVDVKRMSLDEKRLVLENAGLAPEEVDILIPDSLAGDQDFQGVVADDDYLFDLKAESGKKLFEKKYTSIRTASLREVIVM